MLSAMQQRIYDYIAACIQTQGYPPSVREIGEAVGLRSPSTVHFHLKKLADAGVIEIGAGKGRAITLTDDEATVKRFSRKNGHIWLLPENDDYEPIDGTYAQILGKVVAVVRQY